jgi:hypothetical protein
MDNRDISKWGHPYSDQGGQVDILLLKGLTEDEIIKAFAKNYPDHENPRGRVLRHLRHLEKDHKVDLYQYVGKGINTSPPDEAFPIKQQFKTHLPNKEDIEYAESMLRKSTEEIISRDAVLNQVEINFRRIEKQLKENWREITIRNIGIWFEK